MQAIGYGIELKDFYLMNILSQGNSFESNKKVKKSVELWKNDGTFESQFSKTIQIALDLSAGNISKEIFKYDWKVVLLCFLTCVYPAENTVNQVFDFFQENLNNFIEFNNKSYDNYLSYLGRNDIHFCLIKLYSTLEKTTIYINKEVVKKESEAVSNGIGELLTQISRTNSLNMIYKENNSDNHLQFIILYIIKNILLDSGYNSMSHKNRIHLTK